MQATHVFDTIDTHTAGEPTRLLINGLENVSLSGTVAEQRDQFAENNDETRNLLLKEPRGHHDMFGAVVVAPRQPEADLGLFFMDTKGYLEMCGHGTMGAITALIETGRLSYQDSSEPLLVETPSGLIATEPVVEDQTVKKVKIQGIQSFYYDNIEIDLESVGAVNVDIVYAGNFFAMVDANDFDTRIRQNRAEWFVDIGLEIRQKVNKEVSIQNPITGCSASVKLTEFYQDVDGSSRNVTVFGTGQIDRSPCGTGTCAKMTLLHERGELEIGESFTHESIIGTKFEGCLGETRSVNKTEIINAEVEGSAYITGKNTFFVDPNDPLHGFTLTEDEH